MCGIWGRFTRDREILADELVYPVRSLAHRGPDGYGWYLEPRAALVHTRLSIIDVSGGAQPLRSFDGRFLGVVNGELYDYMDSRKDLEAKGVGFATQSDSEVLLNLFATGGADALSRVSGEFAFLFYDRKESVVFFGRDLHGVKPLFLKLEGGELTLASEIKALSPEKPVLDPVYVKRFFAKLLVPPRTAVESARHVLPGRLYRYELATGRLSFSPLQRIPFSESRSLRGAEAAQAVGNELRAAVRRRLVADVEVGCYLSGGLDSSLVAALMVEQGARPKAFTVGFTDAEFDERHKAEKVAAHLGLPHVTTELNRENFLPSFVRSIVAFENPVANAHGAAKNLLSRLAGSQVKVVLSGEGADEWFGGYAYFRIRKLTEFARLHPRLTGNAMAQFLAKENPMGSRHLGGTSTRYDSLIAPYFDGLVPALFARSPNHETYELITGQSILPVLEGALDELAAYRREEVEAKVALNEVELNMWTALRTDLLHYILGNLGDRQEMANSLEGRTPFLDIRVAEVAARLDPTALLKGLVEKQVLREVARGLLPAHAEKEKKHAFFSPVQYLYEPAIFDEMSDFVALALKELTWLPVSRCEQLVRARREGATGSVHTVRKNVRLTLFSLGVLIDRLREVQLANPRGYPLPQSVPDLAAHRREFA